MKRRISLASKAAVMAGIAVLYASTVAVRAEPVTDRILSHYQITQKNGCTILKVNFNIRIRYMSHFPAGSGKQLQVMIRPVDPAHAATETLTNRESLRAPEGEALALHSIAYESMAAQGPSLSLQFTRMMAFNVAPGVDQQSLIIAVAANKNLLCPAEDPSRGPAYETTVRGEGRETIVSRRKAATQNETVIARREAGKRPSPDMPAFTTEVAPEPAETPQDSRGVRAARAAMKQGDIPRAISLLKGVNEPEAMELLGVAYQKNKQTAEARAVYENYMRRYGNGEGAEGVRQRLAAMDTAHAAPEEKLRGGPDEREVRDSRYWSVSGSISETYIRDDSFKVLQSATQPLNINGEADDHRVHRDVLLSSVDVFANWGDITSKSKFRFTGTQEHSFQTDGDDTYSVAALFYENANKEWGTMARVGRQTRSSDGVLGRFDGAYASYQATPWMRVGAVGGSPVASRKDMPFKDDRYFYGTSVNFSQFLAGFDTSFFFIEQRDREILDRQAVGTELRYADPKKSAFLTVDYDTYFNELNAAIFNTSVTFADNSTARASADYRKAPYLNTWTAIQQQQAKTLYELLQTRTEEEAKQMASDRTATYKSASAGYTRQITDKLQVNVDFTAAHIDGTIASYNAEATPSSGDQFYYSAQLIGNNLLTADDLWSATFRYSDLEDSSNYAVDLSTRYSVTKDWRVSPRVLLSYREGKTSYLEEYSILPVLLTEYVWMKDYNFELEVGTRLTQRQEASGDTNDAEVFITAGIRYDFYAGKEQLK